MCSLCLISQILSWEKKYYCHRESRTEMCRFGRICLYKEALTLAALAFPTAFSVERTYNSFIEQAWMSRKSYL